MIEIFTSSVGPDYNLFMDNSESLQAASNDRNDALTGGRVRAGTTDGVCVRQAGTACKAHLRSYQETCDFELQIRGRAQDSTRPSPKRANDQDHPVLARKPDLFASLHGYGYLRRVLCRTYYQLTAMAR